MEIKNSIQMTSKEKKRFACKIVSRLSVKEIKDIFGVTTKSASAWTSKARKKNKIKRNQKIFDLYFKHRLTQQEISDILNVPRQTISNAIAPLRKNNYQNNSRKSNVNDFLQTHEHNIRYDKAKKQCDLNFRFFKENAKHNIKAATISKGFICFHHPEAKKIFFKQREQDQQDCSGEKEMQNRFKVTLNEYFLEYVKTHNGEVDILTESAIYELKYNPDLGDLHRAFGQLFFYSSIFKNRKLFFVSNIPIDKQYNDVFIENNITVIIFKQ